MTLRRCRAFFSKTVTFTEENQGSIALAVAPQMLTNTKHIAMKYHHVWSFVANGEFEIKHVDTKEHITDIFTMPLDTKLFGYLCYKINGW